MYPDLKGNSFDDLVVDTKKYALLRKSLKPVVIGYPSEPRHASSVNYGTQQASCSHSNVQPAISPAFKNFEFFPEVGAGKGPKHIKTSLDRAFAVSNKIVINELARGGRFDKDGNDKIKAVKSKGASIPKKKSSTMKPTTAIRSSPRGGKMTDHFQVASTSQGTSVPDQNLEGNDQSSPVVLLDQQPSQFCWVGVRATSMYKLHTGREVKTRVVRIGKVIKIFEETCRVDFYQQKDSGLWEKDGSCSRDVLLNDVIVVQKGVNQWDSFDKKDSAWRYKLPEDVINIVSSYFEK